MDTLKFLDAVRSQDMTELAGVQRKLADDLLAALSQTSTEFHTDMLHLLGGVTEWNDLADLIGIVDSLQLQQRTQLIAFIITGDSTEEFMKNLDTNPQLQHAVDIAFAAHIDQLHDFGQALNNVQEFIEGNKEKDEDTDS